MNSNADQGAQVEAILRALAELEVALGDKHSSTYAQVSARARIGK